MADQSLPDYTQWPQLADVQVLFTSAGLTAKDADTFAARCADVTAEVAAEVGRRTLRQFLPGPVDETRHYDGSGSPEQEVDEMVDLELVQIVGLDMLPVYTLDDARLTFQQGRPRTLITVARGSVPAFVAEGVFLPYPWRFPAGRQNVSVTGQFGYAAQVPADLWGAVRGEIGARLAREAIFTQAGRVSQVKTETTATTFSLAAADALLWHEQFVAVLGLYKRPAGRKLRNMRPRMTN